MPPSKSEKYFQPSWDKLKHSKELTPSAKAKIVQMFANTL